MSDSSSLDVVSGVSADDYNAFIRQLRLQSIWLAQATMVNRVGPGASVSGDLQIGGSARWQPEAFGFRVFQDYTLLLKQGDATPFELAVTFGVDYASNVPLTDAFFAAFQQANLPLNTWPYLREFLSTAMSRMGWGPFTLPTFTVSPPPTAPPTVSETSPADQNKATSKKGARGRRRVPSEPDVAAE